MVTPSPSTQGLQLAPSLSERHTPERPATVSWVPETRMSEASKNWWASRYLGSVPKFTLANHHVVLAVPHTVEDTPEVAPGSSCQVVEPKGSFLMEWQY